jgi:hypothetical protein
MSCGWSQGKRGEQADSRHMRQGQPNEALPRLLCDAGPGSIRKSCPVTPVAVKQRIVVVFSLHTARSIWVVISTASKTLITITILLGRRQRTQKVMKAPRPSAKLITNWVYRSRCSALGFDSLDFPSPSCVSSLSAVHSAVAADVVSDIVSSRVPSGSEGCGEVKWAEGCSSYRSIEGVMAGWRNATWQMNLESSTNVCSRNIRPSFRVNSCKAISVNE